MKSPLLKNKAKHIAKKTSRNVYLIIFMCALWGLADSIWTGTILVSWLYLVTNGSNSQVGIVEAAGGLSTLVTALPIGYIADKFGRAIVVRVGGFGFFCATLITGLSFLACLNYVTVYPLRLCCSLRRQL